MTGTPFDQPSASRGSTDPEGGDGAYSFDGKPDRWKRYRLPDPETGKPAGWTRATTFAKSISDTYALSMWGLRTGGYGLVLRPDLLAALAAAWPDREKCNQIMEEAKNAAGSKVGANLGTALHAFSEALDRGEDVKIPPPYQPHMAAYTALMQKYGLELVEIEQVVLEEHFGIAGTFDRVVRFTRDVTVDLVGGGTYTFRKGTLAILDLKTGKDLEYGWLEITIQLAIYSRAKRIWDKVKLEYRPMPEVDQDVALVVHLPATAPGETVKATMYAVDIASGWADADLCAQVRAARKKKNLATALTVVEEAGVAGALIEAQDEASGQGKQIIEVVREPTLVERAQAARTEDELTALWWEGVRKRQDSKPLADAIRSRKQAILAETAAG